MRQRVEILGVTVDDITELVSAQRTSAWADVARRSAHEIKTPLTPIILSAERPGRFALSDAPFFAVVRTWKANHRAALAAEGLELPPLTAPIPIIRQGAPVAAR